jgi:hypothetical protein
MDNLYNTINNKKYDATTRLQISYSFLNSASRYKYFKPCVKRYLSNHVRSKYLTVEPMFWDAALMLPLANFQKASTAQVWRDSQRMVK